MSDSAILKLVFSVTFLRNRVPRNQAFAAGAAAALIPGPLGLAVPLIVAGRKSIPRSVISTVAVVPNVIGEIEQDAKDVISARQLKPVVSQSFFIAGGTIEEGMVVAQDPKSGLLVRPGTEVKLTVSLGAPQLPEDESPVHLQIRKDIEAAQTAILKEIREHAAKDTPYGGAPE
jgi:beta-lactam-binding protein with PASTA domain